VSRKDYYRYGVLLVAVAGVVVFWYPPVAISILIVGLCVVGRGAYLDHKYGENRPTKREVGRMSAKEYLERLRDSRFQLWIEKGLKWEKGKFPSNK